MLAAATLIMVAAGLGYSLTRDVRDLLDLSVSRSSLWALIIATLSLLLLRGVVAFDAYWTATHRRPPRRTTVLRRLGTTATLAVLAVLIAAPHLIVVRLATAQLTLLSEVFVASDTQTARPTPIPDTTVTTPTTPEASEDTTITPNTTAPPATEAPDTAPKPDPAPSTSTPVASSNSEDRLTIALLGSDGGYGRIGVRTDTIIVLSIDVATGDAAAFNIPRNWRRLTFPAGTAAAVRWPEGFPGIANEIYGLGLHYPEAFPEVEDKAGHAVKSALAQLTGLDIQYYVMADMVGFVKVIDMFAGIELQVTESIEDRIKPIAAGEPSIGIKVEPGYHRLDGRTALAYVRSRAQSTDWHRMTRQRCVIGALIDQVTPLEVLANFVRLTEIISLHVTTDIPLDRLGDLIAEADRLDTSRIVTVNFIPPEYPAGDAPIRRVRDAVAQALEGGRNEANAILADACR